MADSLIEYGEAVRERLARMRADLTATLDDAKAIREGIRQREHARKVGGG